MKVYQNIDVIKLKKFFDILSKLDRMVNDLYGGPCEKEVFVRRVSRIIKFRPIKYIHYDIIGYSTAVDSSQWINWGEDNSNSIKSKKLKYIYPYQMNYHLGHGEEIDIYYHDPINGGLINTMKMSFNDLLKLKFQEINKSDYEYIINMFKVTE